MERKKISDKIRNTVKTERQLEMCPWDRGALTFPPFVTKFSDGWTDVL